MKRALTPFLRISASLLVALALFTNVGCNEGSSVADNQQPHSIAQQAVDNIRNNSHGDFSHLPQFLQDAIAIQDGGDGTALLSINGVNGLGVTEENGKAVFVVMTERDNVANIPASVKGIKTKVENVGVIRPFGKPQTGYKGTYRPVKCGVSIGNDNECAAGTLGCIVKKPSGVRYMLSNWHVISGANGDGGQINQPGRYDGIPQCSATGRIGQSDYLNPISFTSNNIVDAALATIDEGMSVSRLMADGTNISTVVQPPATGLAVRKVGRTTGVTTGNIGAINVTIKVQYDGGVATFTNQIYVKGQFIQSGDSGSLMTTNGNGYKPVGLCFAGSGNASYANPIQNVLNECGVVISDN